MNLVEYKKISKAMNFEIEVVFKKYGFNVKKINAAINAACGEVKVTVHLLDGKISPTKKIEENFHHFATMYGYDRNWLGKHFNLSGETYKIVGWDLKKSKNKLCMQKVSTGKNFIGNHETLLTIIKSQLAA